MSNPLIVRVTAQQLCRIHHWPCRVPWYERELGRLLQTACNHVPSCTPHATGKSCLKCLVSYNYHPLSCRASSSMCHMSMPAIWNAVRNGEPVADTHAAHCVVDAIAQASILERP